MDGLTMDMPPSYIVKRAIDCAAASAGLLVLSPLMLGLAIAIKIDSPGGALFVQARVGQAGKTFNILKFRTMQVAAPVQFNPDGSTRIEAGDARLTRVGRHLRGAIDELPQLVNVLRGEMSLVGPRPDMTVHAEQYTTEEWRKLSVLPGITSLAAVLGRTTIPWKRRIAIDLRYIDSWSLALDAKILIQTFMLPFGVRFASLDKLVGELLDGA